jgi:hypothetical protein
MCGHLSAFLPHEPYVLPVNVWVDVEGGGEWKGEFQKSEHDRFVRELFQLVCHPATFWICGDSE